MITEMRNELTPDELDRVSGGVSDAVKTAVIGVVTAVASSVPVFGSFYLMGYSIEQGRQLANNSGK